MESDLEELDIGLSDIRATQVVAPPAHRDVLRYTDRRTDSATNYETSIHNTSQVRPLPAGYELPFFTPFCYSPYGTSPLAQQSRRLRDQVKHADPATLEQCAARVAAMIEAQSAPRFLRSRAALVPVPRRIPGDPRSPTSAPVAIAHALYIAGLGGFVWPALRRARAVPKSAWARPASRPGFLEHCTSLELLDREPPTFRVLLIDDFVSRGRTLLAAAAVLYQAIPGARIRALALIRTEGLAPDIGDITAPRFGVIRYLGGDAFRSP